MSNIIERVLDQGYRPTLYCDVCDCWHPLFEHKHTRVRALLKKLAPNIGCQCGHCERVRQLVN